MEKKVSLGLGHLFFICCAALFTAWAGGCAAPKGVGPPGVPPAAEVPAAKVPPPVMARTFPDFVAVIAQKEDTLSSLAARYLRDPSMDWFIAEFNETDTLHPGQALIIPLKPYERGGLTAKGYQTVPVLSYHNFSLAGTNKMTVTQESFDQQMKLLKDKGYRVISMDQLLNFLDFKTQIPKKSVVITIDDGWRSAYDVALPILEKYGYAATLFVYTDLITGGEKTLSWELVQELARKGIDVEGHTKTHRSLTLMDKKEIFKSYFEAIEKEVSFSTRMIKDRLNKNVKYFAYPYGDTNPLVIELLKKNGYQAAFTVKRGGNPFFTHDYRINRSMIYGEFDLNQFEKNLSTFSDEALK